jgi:hypothetical protein
MDAGNRKYPVPFGLRKGYPEENRYEAEKVYYHPFRSRTTGIVISRM